jgi:quinol monooxygenase YgiN
MIHVLAIVTTHPGMRAQVLDAYRTNLPAVRAESGCIAYEAVVDVDHPAAGFARFGVDSFVVVEQWATIEALQAHAVAPHMKAYSSKIKDWVIDTAIHVLQPA